ncbi:MAG: hypothetical protein ACSLE9_07940 [Burkholderiaceae bacterium]
MNLADTYLFASAISLGAWCVVGVRGYRYLPHGNGSRHLVQYTLRAGWTAFVVDVCLAIAALRIDNFGDTVIGGLALAMALATLAQAIAFFLLIDGLIAADGSTSDQHVLQEDHQMPSPDPEASD